MGKKNVKEDIYLLDDRVVWSGKGIFLIIRRRLNWPVEEVAVSFPKADGVKII
jgi:hypothetical protein